MIGGMATPRERNTVAPVSWKAYVQRHLAGRTQAELASVAGVSQTAVSRWLKGTQGADARVAIDLARAVGDPPLQALVAAGFLTDAEAKVRPSAQPSFDSLNDDELLAEVRRRMSGEENDRGNTAPIAEISAPNDEYRFAAQKTGPKTRANRARRRAEKDEIPDDYQGEAPEGGA